MALPHVLESTRRESEAQHQLCQLRPRSGTVSRGKWVEFHSATKGLQGEPSEERDEHML